MGTNNLNRESLEKLFSGVSKDKLESAIKKAEILSKNPQIRNSFSKISDSQVKSMLSALSDGDKQKIMNLLQNSNSKDINALINNLKNNL